MSDTPVPPPPEDSTSASPAPGEPAPASPAGTQTSSATAPPSSATAQASSASAQAASATAQGAAQPFAGPLPAPAPPFAPLSGSATRIIPGLVPPAPPSGPASASGPRTLTPKPVVWRSWPIVDYKLEPAVLILVVVGAVALVWRATESPTTAAICGLAMAVTVWRQFVPTFFELSALGVTSRTLRRTRRIPWLSIDRYVIGKRGVFLSSAGAPLEVLRGLYLPWGTHRDEILISLRYYLPRAEEVKS